MTAVSQGGHGLVAISGAGVSYTPAPDFTGIDTFTYTISDGNGGTDVATVTVTVTSANDAPRAADDVASVPEDGSVTIHVLDNDADVDGDALHLTIVSPPAHGTATVDDRGTPGDPSDDIVVYTPAPGFSGGDSFVYQVDDGNAAPRPPR